MDLGTESTFVTPGAGSPKTPLLHCILHQVDEPNQQKLSTVSSTTSLRRATHVSNLRRKSRPSRSEMTLKPSVRWWQVSSGMALHSSGKTALRCEVNESQQVRQLPPHDSTDCHIREDPFPLPPRRCKKRLAQSHRKRQNGGYGKHTREAAQPAHEQDDSIMPDVIPAEHCTSSFHLQKYFQ